MSESDLLNIFWEEVSEILATLNDGLLKVEMVEGEEQQTLLQEMNRHAHSMKGAARAVGIDFIEQTAHYMEEIFDSALKRGLEITPEIADSLYDGLDLIQNALDNNENKPDVVQTVLDNLKKASTEETSASTNHDSLLHDATEVPALSEPLPDMPDVPADLPTPTTEVEPVVKTTQTVVMRPAEESLRVSVTKLDNLMAEASELIIAKMQSDTHENQVQDLQSQMARWQREWRTVRTAYIRLARRIQSSSGEDTELMMLFRFLESNQRYLMQTRRELAHLQQTLVQDNLHLSTVADQLQDDISRLRMMPCETMLGAFQRMVRDIGRDVSKKVQLFITGGHIEIDKTVLDALRDPIMHILRNAIDHGLESPNDRLLSGKLETGKIELTVEQKGGEINISVKDDGRGFDIDKIRASAVEKGLVTEHEAKTMTADEARALVFHSGFSTKEDVTKLSGRGLGMDIVRERVEGLRGRISIQSEAGVGTTMLITVPVSLTRIRCVLLNLGDETYAIPSIMISRMETLSRADVYTAEGKAMVNLNNLPMPLMEMGAILNIPQMQAGDDDLFNVVALHSADRHVAFEVDDLQSELELVLKPLGPELQQAPYVSGASLLGTGEVVLVLDTNDLIRQATGTQLGQRRMRIVPSAIQSIPQRIRVLVADDSITTRTLEKNILETAGFDVSVAMDGQEAWEMIGEQDFDVVISDVEMPNMNGLELAAHIKGHSSTSHLPVILLTSLGKPEQREAGLRAGADAYLVKSKFDQKELLETIQSVL